MAGTYRPRPLEWKTCIRCSLAFQSHHQRTRYCSNTCRTLAYNQRKVLLASPAKPIDLRAFDPLGDDRLGPATAVASPAPPTPPPLSWGQIAAASGAGYLAVKGLGKVFFSASEDHRAAQQADVVNQARATADDVQDIKAALATIPAMAQAMQENKDKRTGAGGKVSAKPSPPQPPTDWVATGRVLNLSLPHGGLLRLTEQRKKNQFQYVDPLTGSVLVQGQDGEYYRETKRA